VNRRVVEVVAAGSPEEDDNLQNLHPLVPFQLVPPIDSLRVSTGPNELERH
jgi:hypothetical protein